MSKLTGWKTDMVKGMSFLDIVSLECKEAIQRDLNALKCYESEQAAASPQADVKSVEVAIPTGPALDEDLPSTCVLVITFLPNLDQSGNVDGFIAIGRDRTNMTLARDRSKGLKLFVGMLSWDIRSALHGFMNLTGAMLQMPHAKPVERQLGLLKSCSTRLLDRTTNAMNLAETEMMEVEGIDPLRPNVAVDLGAIVEKAITMIHGSVDETDKPLLKQGVLLASGLADSKLPLISSDPQKCTQMIYNLLANACKFTEQGQISVAARHLPDEKFIEIDISDTGRGISEEEQKSIFVPPWQGNGCHEPRGRGVGLGLLVCKSIAESHRGALSVKSELGHGSTFTLSLPCEKNLGRKPFADKEYAVFGQSSSTNQRQERERPNGAQQEIRPECSSMNASLSRTTSTGTMAREKSQLTLLTNKQDASAAFERAYRLEKKCDQLKKKLADKDRMMDELRETNRLMQQLLSEQTLQLMQHKLEQGQQSLKQNIQSRSNTNDTKPDHVIVRGPPSPSSSSTTLPLRRARQQKRIVKQLSQQNQEAARVVTASLQPFEQSASDVLGVKGHHEEFANRWRDGDNVIPRVRYANERAHDALAAG
eukprot:TRINITY_DN91502_c0_g1_i1.p1 TRINITY_DN91502_c0_g1~~TRINITY_DN91502_c0_g1_i1.p1  ORF type:complete len:639 (-),score=124.07 TRINITY_DN91502_c0_g1_i1:95-1876(-)